MPSCLDGGENECAGYDDAGAVSHVDSGVADASLIDASSPEAGAPSCVGDAGCPAGLPAGIYVAPSGSDSAAGTPVAPLKTIHVAIALAAQTKTFTINICDDVYDENVVITTALTLQGGFDCGHGWRATTERVSIKPSKGTPITIDGAKDAVTLSRLYAKAPDAFEAGASSIGLLVANAANVSLDHVEIEAGYGGDGETAAAPPTVVGVAPRGADGQSLASFGCAAGTTSGNCGIVAGGGVSLTNDCHGTGGFGGEGGNNTRGTKPAGGGNGYPAGMGGAGGPVGMVITGPGAGRPGSDGAVGAAATTGFGSVSATGYVATNGGADGQGGQSGGGGGGGAGGYSGKNGEFCQTTFVGAGGGQGGFGGCGGAGGKGAGAGGASIAMLSVSSHVTMTNVTLDTATGGRGGDASPGADGETGGAAGMGGTGSHGIAANCANDVTSGNADQGGPGGRGGKGGPGGPGGGGPSIPLVATGYAPSTNAVVFNPGAGGKGGKGIVGPDGADGLAQEFLPLALASDGGAP